jgi:apolipoprotein N-acyltransferase
LRILLIVVSYLVVAFGQPARSPLLGLLAAACGYALFWLAMLEFKRKPVQFLAATLWFTAVQFVQLSWMTADDFQGFYIWGFWLFFSISMGLQFGLVSLLVTRPPRWSFLRTMAIPAAWTLMEWARLFFSNGFTWNPTGLAMTGHSIPAQMASLGGIYLLSFWVMLCNVFVVRAAQMVRKPAAWGIAFGVVLTPYLFGIAHVGIHSRLARQDERAPLRAVLVQTGLTPDMKGFGSTRPSDSLNPLEQWGRILGTLRPHMGKEIDLILLPEGAVPYRAHQPVYGSNWVQSTFWEGLGLPVQLPKPTNVAEIDHEEYGHLELVDNAYLCHAICDLFKSDLVIGMEDASSMSEVYQAALFFQPDNPEPQRYGKRVLMPLAEEVPYRWLEPICRRYGISGSYTRGEGAQLFDGAAKMGVTICYEETFGNMMRENKQIGAEVLLNVSTDGWYPRSKLPLQHFHHGRLRAIENGVPLLRACHTGVTAAVDAFGNTIDMVGQGDKPSEKISEALYVEVPRYSYSTLYSHVGDAAIVGFSILFLLGFLRKPE